MTLTPQKKKQIMALIKADAQRRKDIRVSREYYEVNNPILRNGVGHDPTNKAKEALRKADNRVPHNFHQLITDEEIDYILSYPPIIDVGNPDSNSAIIETLGDTFLKKSRSLSLEACNCGVAWLHYWIDDKNEFRYARVPSEQVIPIFADDLEHSISEIIRYYTIKTWGGNKLKKHTRVELWTDTTCDFIVLPGNMEDFTVSNAREEGQLVHSLGSIPFIAFPNNDNWLSSIVKYKAHIDAYDIIVSGYVNDVMDIQEVIYILENYAGTDLSAFTEDLKRFKTVSVGSDGIDGSKGDLRTLTIDIPVEARNSLLTFLKKQIYDSGQALPRDEGLSIGNASGQALKFYYKDLDLKVGNKEVEFTVGYKALIRAICKHYNIAIQEPINITFTRNRISNDVEMAQICRDSVGIVPLKYILANHPLVDNVDDALEELEKENSQVDPAYNQAGNYDGGED